MNSRFGPEQCDGKRVFETLTKARQVARRIARKEETAIHPYRCPDCGRLHVGHVTKWNPQERGDEKWQ